MARPIFTWPADHIALTGGTFHLASINQQSIAPFSGGVSAYMTAQRFFADISLPLKDQAGWRDLDGFIARLRGIGGRLRMFDSTRRVPGFEIGLTLATSEFLDATRWGSNTGFTSGGLPTNCAIDEAEPVGANSFVARALPASTASAIKRGDHLEVRPNGIPAPHGHLYIAVSDATTNAAGKARIQFEPGLRDDISAGDQLVLRDASTVFRLADDGQGVIQRDVNRHGRLGLSLIEVLPGELSG